MVIVFGANGQLGRALDLALGQRPHQMVSSAEADFRQPNKIKAFLEGSSPSAIINAAAFTQVDLAESQKDVAFAINAETPGVIADWCARNEMPLIHFSTDYVFDGTGALPWRESDATGPLSVYGQSKLEGEIKILASRARAVILRTSWVYSTWSKNFFLTMLRLGKERERLQIVGDQWGAPTYAADLASATVRILASPVFQSPEGQGVFHLAQKGETSWHGFARAIFDEYRQSSLQARAPLAVKVIEEICSRDYVTPARRPLNSRLDMSRIKKTYGFELPEWPDALHRCVVSLADANG